MIRKHNIALIRQEQTGGDGGAQAIIDIMLKALSDKQDFKISLLCRKWESNSFNAQKVVLNPHYKSRLGKLLSFNHAIKHYIKENKFNLIQSHERIDGCHVFRAGDGVHKVWLEQKKLMSNWLEKWWLSKSRYHQALLKEEKAMYEGDKIQCVICNSHMVKQEILDNFAISEDKLSVIYNGVDLEKFHPVNAEKKSQLRKKYNIPRDALIFIFSGSGFERKNLKTTLQAFSKLDKNCHLVVVGRDKKTRVYTKLAQTLNCSSRTHFLNAQPREKMPQFYQMADVLVLPTLYDPFANVILEALASGLPCITSNKCGAIDIIPKHQCGDIVSATDVDDLYKSMQQYRVPEKLADHAQNAIKTAQQFSISTMEKQLLNLYKQLLD